MNSFHSPWIVISILFISITGYSQNLWEDSNSPKAAMKTINLDPLPAEFRLLQLNTTELSKIINPNSGKKKCLEIPLPDGGFECFEIEESSVMHPDLAAKYPHIKTYIGKSVDNPHAIMRFVLADDEFHAMALTNGQEIFIDKVLNGNEVYYISYYGKELQEEPYSCEHFNVEAEEGDNSLPEDPVLPQAKQPILKAYSPHAVGTELKTYRFAISLAGEVTVSLGGVSSAMTWLTNKMSDLNAIYEREFCMHLELIPNNDTLIFPDPATDPYSGSNWLGESRTLIPAMMGSSNYDIGHLIKPTGGGVAYVGVVCNNSYKSGGTSSTSFKTIAHELGHQMGAGHTFNSCGQYGGGDYEPGSGNTIMSYRGLCGSDNMPGGNVLQYQASSYQEMVNHLYFSGGSNCGTLTSSGHTPPMVSVPASGFTIPISTPFKLVGSATDDGGLGSLTYFWDEYDKGSSQTIPQNPSGTAPLFRSLLYTVDSFRIFPELSKIVNGTNDIGEVLPTYTRDLNFRLMVRDNHPGKGGVDYGALNFHVDEGAGPFLVTIPNNSNTVWSAGQTRTVEWDVANTDVAPVSCATVHILASYDGGYTYPDTLATAVANDGSQDITVPNTVGTQTRIKIEAADNVFFDISDEDFEILAATTHDFDCAILPNSQNVCEENSIDYQLDFFGLGTFNSTIDLVLTGLPSGATSNLPASVPATSSTIWTLGNLNAVTPGHYAMTLTGTETGIGSVSHSHSFFLIIQGNGLGVPGNAMNFDGNDYISIPQIGSDYKFGTDKNFSIECWIKTTSTSGDDAILANKDWDSGNNVGWVIAMESGKINFNVSDGSSRIDVRSPLTYNDDEWHHIAATMDQSGSGTARLYMDGHLMQENTFVNLGDISNDLIIGIGADSENDWEFEGQIEEVRIWRAAMTASEIRENMHRTLFTCEPNLISYYQFNQSSGDALDLVSFYDGTVTGATRVATTCPVGPGTADSQVESTGLVTFTGTDYSANYIIHDAANVTATRINLIPFGTGGIDGADTHLDQQYWVVGRYDKTGSLDATMTFAPSDDITTSDEASPFGLKLYYRASNSDGNWTFLTNASAANDAGNTATFSNVPNYGQFFITRANTATLGVYETQIDFCKTGLTETSAIQSYQIGGIHLTSDITISVTGNFEISLDSLNSYSNQIILSPTGGLVNFTKIFVRTIPVALGVYNGQIDHTSNSATSKTIILNGEGIAAAQDIADSAAHFDGNNDYITISNLSWQPTTFTIEFWLKPFSFSNYNQRIGSGWGSFLFHANSDASFWAGITTGNGDGYRIKAPANTLIANRWSHCAITFDNGTLSVYHNGKLIGTKNNVVNPSAIQGSFRLGDTDDDAIDGHLEEFRIWDVARSAQQIQENMHLTMDIRQGCEEGLICYYQFKDNGDGSITDAMGNHNAAVSGDIAFVSSNVPAAEGVGVEKTVNAAQAYSFDNGGFETNADIIFSGTLPNDVVAISYITGEGSHGVLPTYDVLIGNYWIANNFGDTTALGDITFSLSEDITPADEATPFTFQIYGRSPNAYGNWTLLAGASSASAANNTLTFSQIKTHGQFLIVKNATPEILLTENITDFGIRATNVSTSPQSYSMSAKSIADFVQIVAPAGFEISVNSQTDFATSLDIYPMNGVIPDTTIYLRFLPTIAQAYSANVTHSSTGAISKTIAVLGTGKDIGTISSNALSGSNGDYLSLPRNETLLFGPTQDFTVELWIYTDVTNSDPSIISNKNWNSGGNDGWGLFYLGDNWKVNIDGTSGSRVDLNSNAPDINDGKWHHLVAVFDRDGMLSIYQDGFLTAQTSLAGVYDKNIDAGFPINVLQDGTGTYADKMDAKIDELRLWNIARTTQEIRENMHLTLSGVESGLVAYYQFDETTGDCLDLVGGNHGTLFNNATRVSSDIPAAAGVSVTKDIQTAATFSFDDGAKETNLDIAFSGTLPVGEVVVSNLTGEAPHGAAPTTNTMSDSYWIVNNFGTNTTGLTADMIFQAPSGWAVDSDPNTYQYQKRPSNSISTGGWISPINANTVNTGTDQITFSGVPSFSQFVISKNLATTCSDGILNGDETAIDCGGSCASCGNCIFSVFDSQDFESGLGIWVDGGSDARRDIADAAFANSGSYCVRLRDDTETSHITTSNLDLSTYNEIEVDFSFLPSSMDDKNEDFWLQISTDGGATFTTVEEWNQGDEFENDYRYSGSAIISGPFTATTQLRIQCDASGDSDWVYLDDVVISTCEFTCSDGLQNGDETGVDCGGSNCPACPTCFDGIQNGDETGVDCGGSCPACPTSISCVYSADQNDTPNAGTQTIAVSDTLTSTAQISGSADVQYFAGERILLKPDFHSDNGTEFLAKIQACIATCSDGIQNGDETDIDCGGNSCPACGGATCSDGIQNGDETGTDCGGSICEPCPTCFDGIQNGDETGVDCGGSCSPCGPPCLVSPVVNSTITSGIHLTTATDTITSTENISGTANVEYRAGKVVLLKPGFAGSNGIQFLARIATCQMNLAIPPDEDQIEALITQFQNELAENSDDKNEFLEKPFILLYPNPTNSELHVQIKTERFQPVELTVQNALGSQMHQSKQEVFDTITPTTLDVSSYPPGVYWLRIQFLEDGDWQVVQFVKH